MRLVFAHFGSKIPKHLYLNLSRTATLYPDYQCTLLTDQRNEKFKESNVSVVNVASDENWNWIESKLIHPKNFRKNFWFTSLIRFIELSKFSYLVNEKLIHIESDVVISSDMPMNQLENLDTSLAFPLFNLEMGIASILIINGKSGGKILNEACFNSINQNNATSDMLILGHIAKNYSEEITILPSFFKSEKAVRGCNTDFLTSVTKNISVFGGVFDGLEIGQFIFGEDPRNHRGVKVLRRPNQYGLLNVGESKFIFTDNREFPYFQGMNGETQPLFSIHVHSKNKNAFKLNNSKFLRKYFNQHTSRESKLIDIFTLVSAISSSLVRRSVKVRWRKND